MDFSQKPNLTAGILCLLITLAASASAQTDPENVVGWKMIDVAEVTYGEQVPEETGEPIERFDTIASPTFIKLPANGADGTASLQIEVIDGEAELFIVDEEGFHDFPGSEEIDPDTQRVVAVVPGGKAVC